MGICGKEGKRMAEENEQKKQEEADEPKVQIGVSVYRSLILDKLRAEIAAQQATLELAKTARYDQLVMRFGASGYYRMPHWEMPHWEMPHWTSPKP
jgi:hypothetical protein